jgi:predicted nuclease of predicted toxin-antitoxin system
MKILIDVCLSPDWVMFFREHGVESVHWTMIGECDAEDSAIFSYANEHEFIIFTHDLDFGTLLAQSKSNGPSVIQARVQDPSPEAIGVFVLQLLRQFETPLHNGAIVTLAADKRKVRILPIT